MKSSSLVIKLSFQTMHFSSDKKVDEINALMKFMREIDMSKRKHEIVINKMINKTLKVESMNTKQKRSILSKMLQKLYAALVGFAEARKRNLLKN